MAVWGASSGAIVVLALLPGTGEVPTAMTSPTTTPVPGSDAGRLTLNVINDAFGSTMDEGYTSGLRLTARFAPFIGDGLRGWMRGRLGRASIAEHWGLTGAFDIYTPTNLEGRTAQVLADDRPYAGYWGLSIFDEIVFRGSIAPDGYTIATLGLEGGLTGPSTRTEQIQRSWHGWVRETLNSPVLPRDPKGWGAYQTQDAFLIGLRFRLESDAFRVAWGSGRALLRNGSRGGARVSGSTDCEVGTIRVECDLGTTVRVGYLPRVTLEGALPVDTWDASSTSKPRFPLHGYLFVGMVARFTAYDAFLDGPVGTDSPSIDRRSFGAEGQVGLAARIGAFEFIYRFMMMTREMEDIPPEAQKLQRLGQFLISAAWN